MGPGTNPDAYLWLERMAKKGWTVPTWPAEYGGAGVTMIGATLLEYGNE